MGGLNFALLRKNKKYILHVIKKQVYKMEIQVYLNKYLEKNRWMVSRPAL